MEISRQVGSKFQVVIPRDVRAVLGIQENQEITFVVKNNEVTIKKKQTGEQWLNNFLRYRLKGKEATREELKKIEEEAYDVP